MARPGPYRVLGEAARGTAHHILRAHRYRGGASTDGVGQGAVRHDGADERAVHRFGGGAERAERDRVRLLAAFESDDHGVGSAHALRELPDRQPQGVADRSDRSLRWTFPRVVDARLAKESVDVLARERIGPLWFRMRHHSCVGWCHEEHRSALARCTKERQSREPRPARDRSVRIALGRTHPRLDRVPHPPWPIAPGGPALPEGSLGPRVLHDPDRTGVLHQHAVRGAIRAGRVTDPRGIAVDQRARVHLRAPRAGPGYAQMDACVSTFLRVAR